MSRTKSSFYRLRFELVRNLPRLRMLLSCLVRIFCLTRDNKWDNKELARQPSIGRQTLPECNDCVGMMLSTVWPCAGQIR
jgi:hypothetical protein